MINSPPPVAPEAAEDPVHTIVRGGPHGAIAVAGIATAIVVVLWFAFYILVFLPRGAAL
jgi:hypothetical protein